MKTLKPLKDRLTKKLLEDLRLRKISNAQAAEKLGVSNSYLSRTVAAMQEKVPGAVRAQRKANSELAQARRQTREELAKKVKRGELAVAVAAKRANCSERTIARYVASYTETRGRGRRAAA